MIYCLNVLEEGSGEFFPAILAVLCFFSAYYNLKFGLPKYDACYTGTSNMQHRDVRTLFQLDWLVKLIQLKIGNLCGVVYDI